MNKKQKITLARIIATVLIVGILVVLFRSGLVWDEDEISPWIVALSYAVPYLIVGYDVLLKAVKGIFKGHVLDENFLMAVASVGAFAIGEYIEGVAVILFYQVGELFEDYAVDRSRKNISDLMDITEDVAYVVDGDEVVKVDSDEVEVGTIIEVKPGDKIPLDGVIVEGSSVLDTAALTGESKPIDVSTGTEVLSGSINVTSVIRIETTAEFGESTAAKILDLVENASSQKSESEKFISKFSRFYTPIVCILALAVAIIPPVISGLTTGDYTWSRWIHSALTFLVISCPCALVVSLPLSFFAGIGAASSKGVLIKGSNYLEALSKVDTVLFDKTGTLTKGNFKVTKVAPCSDLLNENELLKYAASAEYYTNHPIGHSLIEAYGEDIIKPEDVEQIGGQGITAVIDGHNIAVGNKVLMSNVCTNNGTDIPDIDDVGTLVFVAVDNTFAGYIVINDEIKEESYEAIQSLYTSGVKDTGMLTGDEESVAKDIADKLGLTKVHAKLLPVDKVTAVEQEMASGAKVAFVGDGINDAPVITRADVGVAMGAMGSDAAIEAADIVLMDDDPRHVSLSIRIAKKCMRIVYENIYFSIGIKIVVMVLGFIGMANMWFAIFADVGVLILAILNAIRCLRCK